MRFIIIIMRIIKNVYATSLYNGWKVKAPLSVLAHIGKTVCGVGSLVKHISHCDKLLAERCLLLNSFFK